MIILKMESFFLGIFVIHIFFRFSAVAGSRCGDAADGGGEVLSQISLSIAGMGYLPCYY